MVAIAEYEERILAALDRIGQRAEAGGDAAAAAAEAQALQGALEEERVVTAQLEERVRSLKSRERETVARLEAEIAEERARSVRLDAELQNLQNATSELVDIGEALRRAVEDGLPDQGAVDRAVLAELEALKALRGADRAEVEEILAALRPIVEEAS